MSELNFSLPKKNQRQSSLEIWNLHKRITGQLLYFGFTTVVMVGGEDIGPTLP